MKQRRAFVNLFSVVMLIAGLLSPFVTALPVAAATSGPVVAQEESPAPSEDASLAGVPSDEPAPVPTEEPTIDLPTEPPVVEEPSVVPPTVEPTSVPTVEPLPTTEPSRAPPVTEEPSVAPESNETPATSEPSAPEERPSKDDRASASPSASASSGRANQRLALAAAGPVDVDVNVTCITAPGNLYGFQLQTLAQNVDVTFTGTITTYTGTISVGPVLFPTPGNPTSVVFGPDASYVQIQGTATGNIVDDPREFTLACRSPRTPTVSTVMQYGGGGTIGQGASVPIGSSVQDQINIANLPPADIGDDSGDYRLFYSPTGYSCAAGSTNVFSGDFDVAGATTATATTGTYVASQPGYYSWVVRYFGATPFTNNASSTCGSEQFFVPKGDPTIATQTDATGVVRTGDTVTDSITVTTPAGYPAATGNATVQLIGPNGYSGTVQSTATVALTGTGPATASSAYTIPDSLAGGTYCFRVSVAATAFLNAKSHDNAATECFTVGKPGLTITKLTGAGNTDQTVTFGDGAISYTIRVTSSGTVDAQSVTVTDTLPTGVTWTTISPDCAIAAGVLTCTFGTIAAGQNRTATVTSATAVPACGVYSNTASATATTVTAVTATAKITVRCPTVTIAKTPNNGSVVAPAIAEFTVVVTVANAQAKNVVISDTLPTGTWAIVPAVTGCSITGNQLDCSFGDVGVGSRTIKVQRATTSADCGNTLDNTASVTSGPAGERTTAQDAGAISVTCSAALTLAKTRTNADIGPGGSSTFTVTVTNTGLADATGVTISDTLPNVPGGTWTYAGGDCATAPALTNGGTFACTVGTVGRNGGTKSFSATLSIGTVPTTAACGNSYTNVATLSGATGSPASAAVRVVCPTFTIGKTVDNATVQPGGSATFTVTVGVPANSPATAQQLTFTDTLPNIPGASWTTAGAFTCTPAPASGVALTCTFDGAVAPGASRQQTFAVTLPAAAQIDAAACGSFSNTARTGTTNSPTVTVTVQCADVRVTKTAGSASVNAEGTITYTIDIQNTGTAAATNVMLNDVIPTGLTYVSGSLANASGVAPSSLTAAGGTVTASWASLGASSTSRITFQATANEDTCGPVSNTATVAATNEPAVRTGNNTSTATVTVNCASTLTIAKTASTGTAGAGGTVTYTVTVTNSGSAIATDVAVTDLLPTFTGATWSISGCSNNPTGVSGQSFSCSLGDIARRTGGVDGTKSFTVTLTAPATIAAGDCGPKVNAATITGTQTSASATITVQCPDVSVVKTNTSGAVSAGGTVVFTVVVANTAAGSTGTATGIVVTDHLPVGLALVSAMATVGTPAVDAGTNTVTLTLASLGAGQSATITITATATAGACPSVTNTATVIAGNEPSSRTANNTSSAAVTVTCTPTVTTQVGSAGPFLAGDAISDTATVAGVAGGPTPTGNVTFRLYGPNPTRGYATVVVGTTTATLANGAVTSSGTAPGAAGWYCFEVSYGGSGTYQAVANHRDAATECFEVAAPVVSIVKTVPAGQANPISAGDAISFRIVATNSGSVPARNIVIRDTLPATGATWSVSFANSGTLACGQTLNVVTCSGDLAPGQSVTIDVSSPSTSAAFCAPYVNDATISRANTVLASASASIGVNCSDVTVTKTVANGQQAVTVNPGDAVSYTVTVSNAGPGVATNVGMTDALPAGFVYGGSTADAGVSCDDSASPFTCTVATLAANASTTIVISGTAGPVCSFANTANVAATNEAPGAKTNNASQSVVVTVNCGDLGVTKTAGAGTYSAGAPVSYTVTVTNAGPGLARSSGNAPVVSDTLPLTYGITGWTITGGNQANTCAITANVLSCTLPNGELAANASITVTVTSTATVAATANCGGVVSNTALIDAAAVIGERNTENNTATATTTLVCADISVTKTASAESVTAGDTIGYTITVTNAGPGTAYGVETVDTLPANVTLVTATAGYTRNGDDLTWTLPSLAPGSQSYSVTVRTSAATCGRVTNSVAISADNEAAAGPPVLSSIAGFALPVDDDTASVTTSVVCANVSVEKTGNGPIAAGSDAVFTIVVTNGSAVEARDVVLTDSGVAGYTLGGASASACLITDGTLFCTFATIEASGTRTVTLTHTTGIDDCETITNTASLAVGNQSTTPERSTATIDVTCADVEVNKEVAEDTVSAGDTITYTVTVQNTGDGAATNVIVSDTLPANTTLVSAEGDPIDTDGTLTWTIASLAEDADASFVVVVRTSNATCGEVDNQATVTANNDSDLTNNQSGIVTTTVDCPDLTILKEGATAVTAGDTITYTITVTNDGPGLARNITVTDQLPAGGTLGEVTPAPTSNVDGLLTWTIASLEAEATSTFTVAVVTGASDCGDSLLNTAMVSATNEDPAAVANNESSVTTTVACPDVSVEKTGNGSIAAGTDAVFTIVVTNESDVEARNVTLIDASVTGYTVGGTDAASCQVADDTLSCAFATIEANGTRTITLTRAIAYDACDSITNTASLTVGNQESTPADSTATIDVTCADVEISKEVTEEVVSAGDTITYTVTVRNTGDGAATNVTVSDPLPANTTLVSAEGDPIDTDGTLTWTIAMLTADGSISYRITVLTSAATCGEATNQASTAADNDSDPTNNQSGIVSTTVNCPNIEIEKTGTETVNAPGQIVYTVTVRNTGAGEAKGVTVSDTLPAGTGLVSADGAPSRSNRTLTWSIASLASDASVSYRIVVSVGMPACGTVTNTASVSAGNDPVATVDAPRMASATTTVTCAEVTIVKVASTDTIRAGGIITYTLTVTNTGNGVADRVIFDDIMPANLTFMSATGDPEMRDGNPTWIMRTMTPGQSASVTVVARTLGGSCDAVVNQARVGADNDSFTGNNAARAETTMIDCGQSEEPSPSPSVAPSDPGSSPSSSPSNRPSDPASARPSASPSSAPSDPTSSPSATPSDAPSVTPSSDPSRPATSPGPSDVPVTGLPSTGTGSGPTTTIDGMVLSLTLMVVALIALIAMVIARHGPARAGGAETVRRTVRR